MSFFLNLDKFKIKKLKKNNENYALELLLKTKIITKTLKNNSLIKLNLKLNLLQNFVTNLIFKTKLNLLKKNYYNLINTNNFFEKLTLSFSNLKIKKKKTKRFLKLNLIGLKFHKNYFLFFFLFFLLKKNVQKKVVILKNFSLKRKNYRKKKPLIKLDYLKLFKNISSYHNEENELLYNLDQISNLTFKVDLKLDYFKINYVNNLTINLLKFNFFKIFKV